MHPIWAAHPRTHLFTEYPPPRAKTRAHQDILSPVQQRDKYRYHWRVQGALGAEAPRTRRPQFQKYF